MTNSHKSYLVALSWLFFPAMGMAQNVGIGTNAPSEKLHVYQTTGNSTVAVQSIQNSSFSSLQLVTGSSTSDLLRYGSNSGSTIAGINANNATRLWSGDGRMIIGTGSANNLHFVTAATERMVINGTGQVGIGVTNPIGVLEVDAGILSETSVRLKSSSDIGIRQWFMMGNDLTAALVIARFGTSIGGNLFGLPVSNLSAMYTNDAGVNALALGNKNNIPLVFGTSNLERARIQGNGTMGIATATPNTNAQLHVKRPGTSDIAPVYEIGAIYGENGNTLEGSGVYGVTRTARSGNPMWAGVTGINYGAGTDRYGVIGYTGGTSAGGTYAAGVGGFGDYGVYAFGYTAAILAEHGSGGTAVELKNGFLKVTGDNKTAFKHTTAVGNISGNFSYLTYAIPSATDIVIVTHNFSPTATYLNKAVGVFWEAGNSRWCIYNEDLSNMPTNITFNVLVIKQ
ncbi:MAG: hypothetical protein LCH58_09355 [Bacteroidetes bacterium]|uniref:DUF7452 domain-containing protein n=1 Tax=Phnomibacter sp. TaxID=2836217 RepID=UPI002FDE6305|nr:hypothetical protein [Bacteroidota bacterium]